MRYTLGYEQGLKDGRHQALREVYDIAHTFSGDAAVNIQDVLFNLMMDEPDEQ